MFYVPWASCSRWIIPRARLSVPPRQLQAQWMAAQPGAFPSPCLGYFRLPCGVLGTLFCVACSSVNM